MSASSLTSSQNINGIYIPCALLIFGTVIVKKEWTPYAALLALVLGAFKLYSQCRLSLSIGHHILTYMKLVPKKFLKPDVLQDLELKEKTILSHNTAM